MIRFITGLLAAVLAMPFAAAQDDVTGEVPKPRRYTVEIIVFTYAEDVAVGTEVFPPDEPIVPDDEIVLDELLMGPEGVAIDADGEPIPEFTDTAAPDEVSDEELLDQAEEDAKPELLLIEPVLMLADDFSMQRAWEQLQLLDAYEPILHTGWTQVTLPPEETPALELPYFGEPPAGLEGSFRLYFGRYLHLVVDLTLDAATGEDEEPAEYDEPILSFGDERLQYEFESATEAGVVRYRIQEDRIVKNGDVRYFDHPRFGVVAKVTRVEEPEEDPEAEAAAESAALVGSSTQ